jgi:hypothetical protein
MRSTIKNTHPFEVYVQQPGGERLKAAFLATTWHTRRDITTYISCDFDVPAADGKGLTHDQINEWHLLGYYRKHFKCNKAPGHPLNYIFVAEGRNKGASLHRLKELFPGKSAFSEIGKDAPLYDPGEYVEETNVSNSSVNVLPNVVEAIPVTNSVASSSSASNSSASNPVIVPSNSAASSSVASNSVASPPVASSSSASPSVASSSSASNSSASSSVASSSVASPPNYAAISAKLLAAIDAKTREYAELTKIKEQVATLRSLNKKIASRSEYIETHTKALTTTVSTLDALKEKVAEVRALKARIKEAESVLAEPECAE